MNGAEGTASKKVYEFIKLVLKAVGMAMGVAVVVLSIMQQLSTQSGFIMLGLAVACGGVSALMDKRRVD